jgi:phosphoglycerate dehydrogenase-like enzyme
VRVGAIRRMRKGARFINVARGEAMFNVQQLV